MLPGSSLWRGRLKCRPKRPNGQESTACLDGFASEDDALPGAQGAKMKNEHWANHVDIMAQAPNLEP